MNNVYLEFDVASVEQRVIEKNAMSRQRSKILAAMYGKASAAKPTKPKVRQFLTIPNNPVGWVFLWYLRKRLNRGTYELRIYGRGQKWWVKLHNRIARKHNKPWRDRIEKIRDLPAPPDHVGFTARNAALDKLYKHIWPTWGRSYFGSIKLRHAARFGIYFNEKRS